MAGKENELNSAFRFMFESTMNPEWFDTAQNVFKVLKVFVRVHIVNPK